MDRERAPSRARSPVAKGLRGDNYAYPSHLCPVDQWWPLLWERDQQPRASELLAAADPQRPNEPSGWPGHHTAKGGPKGGFL